VFIVSPENKLLVERYQIILPSFSMPRLPSILNRVQEIKTAGENMSKTKDYISIWQL